MESQGVTVQHNLSIPVNELDELFRKTGVENPALRLSHVLHVLVLINIWRKHYCAGQRALQKQGWGSGSDRFLDLCSPIHTDLNGIKGGSKSVSKMGVAICSDYWHVSFSFYASVLPDSASAYDRIITESRWQFKHFDYSFVFRFDVNIHWRCSCLHSSSFGIQKREWSEVSREHRDPWALAVRVVPVGK